MRVLFPLGAVAVAIAITAPAGAQVFHDEAINGDLSNNGLNPTAFTLTAGTRSLIATTGGGDIDFFSLTIPTGQQLSEIVLASYEGADEIAFIGVMNGPQFTENPFNPNVHNLLGWTHFGPFALGTDMLDDMGNGFGAIGFTPPLPSGTYSFWLNQLGDPTTFQLDFVVVPSPAAVAPLALVGIALLRRRR